MNLKKLSRVMDSVNSNEVDRDKLVEIITNAIPYVHDLSVIEFDLGSERAQILPWKEKPGDDMFILIRWDDIEKGDEYGWQKVEVSWDESPEVIADKIIEKL